MEREINHQRDAEFLAAVLQHEKMPEEITNYIADVVLEMTGDVNICTPEVLRVAWPLIMAQYEHTDATMMMPLFMAISALSPDKDTEALLWKLGGKTAKSAESASFVKDTAAKTKQSPRTVSQDVQTAAPSDLAELISTVLRHTDTPASVREGILQGMCQYSYDDTAPEHIRLILEGRRAQKARV